MSTVYPSPVEIVLPLSPPEISPKDRPGSWVEKPVTTPLPPKPVEIPFPVVLPLEIPLEIKIGTTTFVVSLALNAAQAEPLATET
ncbi:MAG TPA: hypothetical protein VEV42_16295 [Pyrinomonadaceae bacterium]|nr:hypothetical protein [Pyrinomonadaceae bacterium]